MRKISILGSTGSIGTQALSVVRAYPDRLEVVAITANQNLELFLEQINFFKPKYACLADDVQNAKLAVLLSGTSVIVLQEPDRLEKIASLDEVDTVMIAVVGFSGFLPTIAAIKSHKRLCLANKETIVAGGDIVMSLCEKYKTELIPVDSEHSAIFQSLRGGRREDVAELILTASGGALRDYTLEQLQSVKAEQALRHPNWSMGAKVTIDSATLMNKGLEVIEAMHLFAMPIKNISVVVHKESVIHSMVRYKDNSVISQMSYPTMLIPIQLSLSYPERWASETKPLDFASLKKLTFSDVDNVRFPSLKIAIQAAEAGGNAPIILNAANEIAVSAFISNKIGFLDIPYCIDYCLNAIANRRVLTIDDIVSADKEARLLCSKKIESM